jgi:hypothetical protein
MPNEFQQIQKRIHTALTKFSDKLKPIEQSMYDEVMAEVQRYDKTSNGYIGATVRNMGITTSIKNKILKLVLTDKYKAEAKTFLKAFNDVTKLQNEYWKATEASFSPTPILREIRDQALYTTADKLGEAGIGVNIGDKVVDILRTNITTGGTYASLRTQLKTALTQTATPSLLSRYVGQITTDSIHQYNAQYTQQVSSDLGYVWYAYAGSDLQTTRPFCNAMTDFRYFHVSEIPRLLRGEGLTYVDKYTNQTKPVAINPKTKLPQGMIEGTTPENFFIRRGGYQCGHQIRPVNEKLVPLEIRNRVYASADYAAWAGKNVKKPKTDTKAKQEKTQEQIVKKVKAQTPPKTAAPVDSRPRFKEGQIYEAQKAVYNEFQKLSSDERYGIKAYTGSNYYTWNKYLRQDRVKDMDENKQKEIRATDMALRKLPVYLGEVRRGMKFLYNNEDEMRAFDALNKEYQIGNVSTEKGFLSTTTQSTPSFGSRYSEVHHTIILHIKGKNGVPVEQVTSISGEDEVLFPTKTKMLVTNRTETMKGGYNNTKIIEVWLTEL